MLDEWSLSVDCRGIPGTDATTLIAPGTFAGPVVEPLPGEVPIGEILIRVNGVDLRIVAEETGRDVAEVSVGMLRAADKDRAYRNSLVQWVHTVGEA
jgi:hypothetical protein